jgi:HEAT repeat protein
MEKFNCKLPASRVLASARGPANWSLQICILHFAVCNLQSECIAGPPPRAAAPRDSTERLYDGRTLAEWRARIPNLNFTDSDIGSVVPGLLAIVQDVDAPWFSRRQAAITLGRIGQPAQAAVPVLIALLDEPADVPEHSARLWAIKALSLFGPLAADAAPRLIAVLNDDRAPELHRLSSIEALGRIGPAQPDVLPAIIATLDTTPVRSDDAGREADLERRVAAAEILELFKGHAAPAVPALIRATHSDAVLLRRAAANTLGVIGPSAEPAIPALVDLVLFDEHEEVRDLAAAALGKIGAAAERSLAQLLADEDMGVRRRAASALGQLSAAAPATVAALQVAAGDDSPAVRIAALTALWKLTQDAACVLAAAIDEVSHEDREVRMGAVRLLEVMGPAASPGVERLNVLADEGSPAVRQAARRALRAIEAPAP